MFILSYYVIDRDRYRDIPFCSHDIHIKIRTSISISPMGSLVRKATLPGEGSDLVAWCGTGMAAAIHGWRFMGPMR